MTRFNITLEEACSCFGLFGIMKGEKCCSKIPRLSNRSCKAFDLIKD